MEAIGEALQGDIIIIAAVACPGVLGGRFGVVQRDTGVLTDFHPRLAGIPGDCLERRFPIRQVVYRPGGGFMPGSRVGGEGCGIMGELKPHHGETGKAQAL